MSGVEPAGWNETWRYLAAGLCAALGTYRVLSHVLEQTTYELEYSQQSGKKRSRRNAWYGSIPSTQTLPAACQELLNSSSVNFDSISQLALKSDHRLRKAAAELLYDNAMRPEMLALIVKTASDVSDGDMRLRAVTLIRQIALTSTRRRAKIARAGGISALVEGLRGGDHELALRSGWTIMEFLGTQDAKLAKRFRRKAASCGLLEAVYGILESLGEEEKAAAENSGDGMPVAQETRDLSLLGICCNITKVYALRSAFHKQMVDLGYLPVLLCVARSSVGSVECMRIVMESIVRLCTYLSAYKAEDTSYAVNSRMVGLLDLGAVEVIAACVRQDDQSVSSWGIGLLHEFVSRGVGKQQLAASPRIVQWLCRKLSTTKYAYTNQLILRSLWCLSTTSRAALLDASQPANLRRILNMFAGGGNDTESHYWSIALVSRIAVYPGTHVWILNSPLPRALKGLLEGLVPNLRVTLFPEVANIISRMCHSITLAPALCTHPEIAETCRMLLGTDIETAQMATIMAIVNATASSRAFLGTLVDDGVRGRLFELLLDFKRETVQPYAAKCLVALMYSGFLGAEQVVARGLLPFLDELGDKYRALLGAIFMPGAEDDDEGERDEASAWLGKRLLQSMSTASVLLSALQVYLAEAEHHCLEGELAADAVAAMGAFQMCLLAQIATYLMQVLDLGNATHEYADDAAEAHEGEGPGVLAALRNPPASHCGKAEWARVAVNCLVAAYYLHSPGDAHFRAAAEDCRRVVCTKAGSPDDGGWDDRGRRRLSRLVSNEPEEEEGPGFAGDMRSARVRCVLPILRATLAALADSLEPKLAVQAPGVTRRALWLARIVCHEFPSLRAVAMRLLSVIDARSLPSADAAGVARLCCAFLADSLAGAHGLAVDAEQQDARRSIRELAAVVAQVSGPGSESVAPDHGQVSVAVAVAGEAGEPGDAGAEPEWREWRRGLVGIGVAPEGARLPSEYYELYPELELGAMALEGWFHARYAVDRRVFGWESCVDHYSCLAPPPVAAAQGSDCWIIDRSGPRGPVLQRSAMETAPLDDAPAGPADDDVAQQLTEGVLAGVAADALPLSQLDHSAHSSAASVDGGRRRPNRPESPFPATIFPDPSVDAVGEAAAALSRPLRTLSPPTVVYYNQAPYFPSFVSLGDGCTLWNSSWKFESARMRTGIDGARGGVHRFEVQLLTSGLVQVGWCTELCGFFPESGEGVGDDYESVAYDGYRQRKWHGTAEEKEYGEKWHAGDVIGAELDLDGGRVVFYRNGTSMGVAFGVNGDGALEGEACGFRGLSRERTWYPAFSLASDQGLVFLGASINNSSHEPSCVDDGGPASVSDDDGPATVSDAGSSDEKEPIAAMVRELRALGVVRAFKMRFEFQDLDTFPCVALSLPADKGQITVGPLTNAEHLSTYLQPQWWAVWTHHPMSVRGASAPELAAWFAACVEDTDVMSAMLKGNVASWIYFAVLADGRVCVAAGDEVPVVFDIGREVAGDDAHVWLPVVSPAVVSFDVRVICA
ncbi:hypothetical protein H4S07_002821 [Coemansia furcata]|uniref:Uncharacterized protein n=1 Tax=Coemansia furcata TaxID=417177 RepID=A0ACC1LKI4_9FUNG|nr:hypothetical protein H4S07_002821 [Coemansia furcata]